MLLNLKMIVGILGLVFVTLAAGQSCPESYHNCVVHGIEEEKNLVEECLVNDGGCDLDQLMDSIRGLKDCMLEILDSTITTCVQNKGYTFFTIPDIDEDSNSNTRKKRQGGFWNRPNTAQVNQATGNHFEQYCSDSLAAQRCLGGGAGRNPLHHLLNQFNNIKTQCRLQLPTCTAELGVYKNEICACVSEAMNDPTFIPSMAQCMEEYGTPMMQRMAKTFSRLGNSPAVHRIANKMCHKIL